MGMTPLNSQLIKCFQTLVRCVGLYNNSRILFLGNAKKYLKNEPKTALMTHIKHRQALVMWDTGMLIQISEEHSKTHRIVYRYFFNPLQRGSRVWHRLLERSHRCEGLLGLSNELYSLVYLIGHWFAVPVYYIK